MATYAVGDIHGCYLELRLLLTNAGFDPGRDRLWCAGDLVGRGREPATVLRYLMELGDACTAVLGNHDLHLLALADDRAPFKPHPSLEPVLTADDREELLAWLRGRPLMHVEGDACLVHAGLLPEWSVEEATALAADVSALLASPSRHILLEKMYGDWPDRWHDGVTGYDRHRLVVNALTRMRGLTADGRIEPSFTGPPAELPEGCVPWYDWPERASAGRLIVCGHWAAQGLVLRDDLIALDTGCVWNGRLTCIRLDDRAVTQVPCGGGSYNQSS